MTTLIVSLFERDLNKLIEEINLYKNEEDLWKIKEGISNSGGNLTLHLIGNLNHFIGATLGRTLYIRDRDKEFSLKNIPRVQLTEDLKKTIEVIKNTLPGLSAGDLEKDFPVPINNKTSSTSYVLLHLMAHLSYHLGQVNYHRRLIG
ncbi:DinB family protein [Ginsengibacter hankyongi]|uniref:DinB family protein n=1 Tax=Ginsengibacter hankyongi TaxID=2607284 RepID=A0A5J5IAY1_9BACT|nr:DUF1572 family protein [Ginsengibacter hankyongi]KAA9034638.1 DinB family protein [Ginsengibacter hankyongi]